MKSLSVKLGVILIGLIISGYSEVWGAEEQCASLQGLKGIYVLIDGRFDSLVGEGVTKDQLKTDVELQLRKAGINVLTKQESATIPEPPCLLVTVLASRGVHGVEVAENTFYAIGIFIQLYQDVRLGRNPKIKMDGATWNVHFVGWREAKKIKDYVRENLKDLIDLFMNDYLAANPK